MVREVKKHTPVQIRRLIVGAYERGDSFREIAEQFGVSVGTVQRWVQRHNANDSGLNSKAKSGRKRKTSSETDQIIYESSVADSFKPASTIRSDLGLSVSVYTVRRRLKERGLRSRRPATMPLLTASHVAERLQFATSYRFWTEHQWRNVVFSDEKIFRSLGNARDRVWRPPGARYDERYLTPRERNPPHKVNVWGCISYASELNALHRIAVPTLNTKYYVNIILKKYVVPLTGLPQETYFVHDRAPMHTSQKTADFLESRGVSVLPWPPKGADLNPVENVWAELERRTRDRRNTSADDLWETISREFENLESGYIGRLIDSMPNRLQAVYDAAGQWTKY